MQDLRILLLGPPEVLIATNPLVIKRRTPRALLYYLAANGHMSGRDGLLDLFWGSESEHKARSRFRESLSRLRKSLPDPDLIVTNNDLVGLRTERVYIDLLEFQSLLKQAGQAPWQIPTEEPLPEKHAKLLTKAAALWRSPKFLSGVQLPDSIEFEHWLENFSEQVERQYLRLLARLAEHAFAVNDLEQAYRLDQLGLQMNEFDEGLHYHLLQTLVAMGRRSEAREHYQRLEALLIEELSSSPSQKLTSLYQQISSEPDLMPIRQSSLRWNTHPSMQVPFIGRRHDIDHLNRAYQRGGGLFILGESGQGKTRLLQEFIGQLHPAPRVLLSNCKPAENHLTFQPFIEVLRQHILPQEWLALSPAWANQLSVLLPEIAEIRPDLGEKFVEPNSEISPSQARSQIFETIRQVFASIAQRQKLILCLDDAQWADGTTLEAIAYLLERPPFNGLAFLLILARSETENKQLEGVISALAGSTVVHTLRLSQLARPEIQALAATVLGQSPSVGFTNRLARETGGNPLYILEILRAMLERDDQTNQESEEQFPLTESLQQLIHARLAQLSPVSREALEIAAVTGIEFDPEIIAQVGKFRSEKLSLVIDDLIQQTLIKSLAASPGRVSYQFIHSKIREVLLQEISPLDMRSLEGKVAFVLESQKKSQPAILARHFELAGESALAFKYWLHAGQRARRLYSNADAIQAFQQAERMIHLSAEIDDDSIQALYTDWTELAFVLEDDATIRRINNDLLSIGELHGNKLLIGTALLGLSDSCMVNNRFSDGLTYATRSIPYLENSDQLYAWMNAYLHKGVFETMLGRLDESIQDFQEALDIGVGSTDTRVLMTQANAHYQLAVAHIFSGWPASGLNHASIALGDTSALGYQHGRVTAYSALALSRYFLGEYRLARQESQIGIELAERLQAWRMLGYLHTYRAMVELAMGNIDATIHYAQKSIQLGKEYGHAETTATGYRMMGDIFHWLHDNQKAIDFYRIAVQISKDQFTAADNLMRLGLSFILAGQDKPGQDLLTQAINNSERTGMGISLILAQLSQSVSYIFRREWDHAHTLTIHVYNEALRRSLPSVRMTSIQLLGNVAEQTGDLDTAIANYAKIGQEAASLQYVWIEITALMSLARVRSQSGESVQSIRLRLAELLKMLERTAQHEMVRESFQKYAVSRRID